MDGMSHPAFTLYEFTRWHCQSEVAHLIIAYYSFIDLRRMKC